MGTVIIAARRVIPSGSFRDRDGITHSIATRVAAVARDGVTFYAPCGRIEFVESAVREPTTCVRCIAAEGQPFVLSA